MVVVHVIEGLVEGGVLTFLKTLINGFSPDTQHIVVCNTRNLKFRSKILQRFFKENTEIIKWKFVRRNINPIMDLLALCSLILILIKFKHKDTVFHLHSSKAGFLGRLACFFLRKKRVIYTPHGAAFLMYKNGLIKKLYILLEKIGYFLGGKVVCVSLSESEEFERINVKACYVFNGITSTDITKNKREGSVINIVNIGRIDYQKNPKLFEEIASNFIYKKELKFIWVGNGKQKEILKSPNITITGWVGNDVVSAYLNNADIFLSTSRYEGLSYAILEAMSHGLPLVLSDCVGNKDMVSEGYNGNLYSTLQQSIDIINLLIDKPGLRVDMGNNSKTLCNQKFNINSTIGSYNLIYIQTAELLD